MATLFDGIRRSVAAHVALTDDEFNRFTSFLQQHNLERKQALLSAGEVCWFEGYVVSGCLRIHHTDPDGWEFVLDFAAENQWIADIGSFAAQSPAAFAIDALEPTELLLLKKADKERLCQEVPRCELLFRGLTQRAVVSLQLRLIATLHHSAEERYEEFKRRFPGLEGRVAQHQIAAYLGISPEFLSRIRHKRDAVEVVQ
jgi:CRP-like cAMP-binding protein